MREEVVPLNSSPRSGMGSGFSREGILSWPGTSYNSQYTPLVGQPQQEYPHRATGTVLRKKTYIRTKTKRGKSFKCDPSPKHVMQPHEATLTYTPEGVIRLDGLLELALHSGASVQKQGEALRWQWSLGALPSRAATTAAWRLLSKCTPQLGGVHLLAKPALGSPLPSQELRVQYILVFHAEVAASKDTRTACPVDTCLPCRSGSIQWHKNCVSSRYSLPVRWEPHLEHGGLPLEAGREAGTLDVHSHLARLGATWHGNAH